MTRLQMSCLVKTLNKAFSHQGIAHKLDFLFSILNLLTSHVYPPVLSRFFSETFLKIPIFLNKAKKSNFTLFSAWHPLHFPRSWPVLPEEVLIFWTIAILPGAQQARDTNSVPQELVIRTPDNYEPARYPP